MLRLNAAEIVAEMDEQHSCGHSSLALHNVYVMVPFYRTPLLYLIRLLQSREVNSFWNFQLALEQREGQR